jgi:Zn-dependent protease with chaperone function
MNEDIIVVAIVFGTLGCVLFPLARAWARRIEGRGDAPAAMPGDVAARLERIERAVESVAVEVERISEGQRFVTKVLADRGEIPRLPPVQH